MSRPVIYVKSIVAGLATLVVLLAVIAGAPFLAVAVMERLSGQAGGGGFVVFPVWPIITGVLLISTAVSIWIFRRASRARSGL